MDDGNQVIVMIDSDVDLAVNKKVTFSNLGISQGTRIQSLTNRSGNQNMVLTMRSGTQNSGLTIIPIIGKNRSEYRWVYSTHM